MIIASIKLPCHTYPCGSSYGSLVASQPFVTGGNFTLIPATTSDLVLYDPNPAKWTLTSVEQTIDAFPLQITDVMGTRHVDHSGTQTVRFYGFGIPEPATGALLPIAVVVHATIRRRQVATLGRSS